MKAHIGNLRNSPALGGPQEQPTVQGRRRGEQKPCWGETIWLYQ